MFTIEMDWDETAITILDTNAEFEDLQVIMYDDIVYIRQFDEDTESFSLIAISPEMMLALQKSFTLPNGAYYLKKPDKRDLY
mgnify:FL=1